MAGVQSRDEGAASRHPVLVVSRDGTDAAGARRGFEDAVLAALHARGAPVLTIPHAYYLDPSHRAVTALRDEPCDLVVAAWLPPRAAFWTLRALGVQGVPAEDAGDGERTIQCLNLGAFASPEECAEALLSAAGGRPATAVASEMPDAAVRARWYPVLDLSRCKSCRKCMDFCLFGVYSLLNDAVTVTSPDNCKNGCPACARTCPHGAIMFPHYVSDPAISGAAPDASAKPRRAGRSRRRPPDDLDGLISTLEKLDG